MVMPKAKPGLLLITDRHMPKVMDMVKEKRKTPMMEMIMIFFPNKRKGIQMIVDNTPTFLAPKRSLR